MLKLIIGFLAFAAVALYFISKGGDIDISGEKHSIEAPAADHAAASAPVAAPAASAAPAPASAASN
jgi:hypothetical protein